ncbi:MAG: glycosyltransferase family 2 protein [Flavobacteriales bacterium]|nr:glycosyltransferase family 2 protein [Flavobacteriales bacterium]MBT3964211.1 glycosyltransferase family 2 protein [Flavobacteriales bacterium]MBT4704156.1 glycosyltransferase family 2 protein [Flavobacteriales bacterium]MBT4930024.1 glycosyltransferase family 2 protein [Flavobacteriales bacterium]MBT5132398.1 glycosyltransferase family 2 protein [Flavobacteriales bacterium]
MKQSTFPNIKIAVALLTYNNLDLLQDFLPEVIASLPDTKDYGLYVIDNASTDATQEYLAQFGDRINVISIKINRGFTNGYKEGLAQIDADIFCLLSSDVQISKGWLEPVTAMFDADPKIAVIQPKIRSFYHRDEFEYAGACGGFIDKLGYPFCRGRMFYDNEKDTGQYDEPMEIFWASGACFFIRAKIYEESGGLDNDFYAHMEEIDLCWRLKNRGFKIMVCPQSEVYHMGGQVIAYGSPEKTFRNHRNNLIMMMKNLPKKEVFPKILTRLILDQLAFANMIMRGQFNASFSIISAHWSFLFHLGKWRKKRKELKDWVVGYSKSGMYPRSIVFDYFFKNKKKFSDLDW